MPSHNITVGWSAGTASPVTKTTTYTAGSELNLSETVAAASTNLQINAAIDVSALKSLYMLCDRDLLVETNDGTTPDATISLKADVPLIWQSSDGYYTNPLGSTDVTAFYLTLAAGDDATFQVFALIDPTP